jgi:hypothetical protein
MTILTLFSHYLQSNQAPSEDETRELKTLRAKPLEEISIIDVEIERTERILNSLKQKRAHIQESVDDFNTILAPVRRLSADVLGAIFSHCLATHRNPVTSASEAPILLTQICCDWRSIALSIPRLWSRLYIPTLRKVRPYHSGASAYALEWEHRIEARTEEVQKWLRLSAVCPLAITLMPASDPFCHPPLLDSIIQSSRRWQQLELGCFLSPESDVLTRLLSLSPDDLCMLRELRIYSLYPTANLHSQEVQGDLWYQSGLLTAQGLRSISIGDLHRTNAFPAGIPPNWKNLNHLFIHSPIVLGLAHEILTNCCNLVACLLEIIKRRGDLDNNHTNLDGSISLSSCILPHLTFLSLYGDSSGCSYLFINIEAPSLQILEFQGIYPSESEEFGLFDFLQNINSLETLKVDLQYLTESNLVKYYTLVPSVTHLVLGLSPKRIYDHRHHLHFANPAHVNFTILHEFRYQYSPDSSPTLLFPSLEILEAYGIPGVTDIMLLEFIKARIDATKSNANVSKLKKVMVEFQRTRQTDIIPEASAYARAAGIKLELDLTYYSSTENRRFKGLDETWSPSFGISESSGDVSWKYPLHDY